ncbi:HNH endonuclease, partial [Patescibacteria group bacterium]|nr:HNH endonuclease [Patescibacteria group bacterium]
SNFGRVKSFKKCRGISVRMLKQIKNNYGYFYIDLYKNGKKNSKLIHVLMYETFIEEIPEGYIIHHKDLTKNNFLVNFELMEKKEHTRIHHKGKIILEKTKKLISDKNKGTNHPFYGKYHSEETLDLMRKNHADVKGENHPRSILKEQDVIEIRKLCDEGIMLQSEIGRKFGVSPITISSIKNNKIWKYLN